MESVGHASQINKINPSLDGGGSTTPNAQSNPLGRDLASHFISSGCELFLDAPSLGEMITAIPKLFLCTIPEWIGHSIQDGHDQLTPDCTDQMKYWIGRAFKGLAYICAWPLGIVHGAIDTCVAALVNLASFTLYVLAAGEWCNDPFSYNSPNGKNSEHHAQSATNVFKPGLIKKAEQFTLPEQDAARASLFLNKVIRRSDPFFFPKEKVAEKIKENIAKKEKETGEKFIKLHENVAHPAFNTKESTKVDTNDHYPQFCLEIATVDDIPSSILARRDGTENTGEILALHIDTDNWGSTVLKGSELSSIHVGVFKLDGKIILGFPGTCRFGMGITNIALTLGVRDAALDEADKLVAAFVKKHDADKVELAGFSMGGALAQYAGIKNGVKVTAFNAEGLHIAQRNELGEKIAKADVTLINTQWDVLSQGFEHITASSQVGRRYLIPDSNGHNAIFTDMRNYYNKSREIIFNSIEASVNITDPSNI